MDYPTYKKRARPHLLSADKLFMLSKVHGPEKGQKIYPPE